jgi:hypothetical protein
MIRHRFFVSHFGRIVRLMLATVTAVFLACSQTPSGQPPVYPIKGKVHHKGKPISGGVVVFELEGGDSPTSKVDQGGGPLRATGRIEADGSFHLMAFPGTEGVPAGHYKVGVSSMPPRTEANLFDTAGSAKKGNPDVLRGQYADPQKSGLRFQVLADKTNEPTFDLK